MGAFFSYSLQSALCLSIFYVFYKALLSHETFHRLNRYTLLALMALSWLLPACAVAFSFQPETETVVALPAVLATSSAVETSPVSSPSFHSAFAVLFTLYITGMIVCALYQTISYLRLLRLLHKGKRLFLDRGIRLIIHSDTRVAPFSWMKYIAISEADYDEHGDAIIAHETAHIRRYHSWDMVAAQAFLILQWFNPVAWMFYRELRIIHEYEADETVLNEGFEARSYQLLLIKKAVGTRLYSMANGYNHSNNLKKRITMMLQKKSNAWARLKYALVLPLTVTTVAVFARPEISKHFDEISSVKVNRFASIEQPEETENVKKTMPPTQKAETVPITQKKERQSSPKKAILSTPDDTTVFVVVEEMPQFPGGQSELMGYIGKNVKYPQKAIEKKISGRVVVSFVVGKDGTLRDFKVVRAVHPELDAEALRVIKSMPKWNPGRQRGKNVAVKYTIPVNFSLSHPKDTVKQ